MRLLYLSHPEVNIDAEVPVPKWGLSKLGQARMRALAGRGWPGPGWRIISSPEVKAMETAQLIAGGTLVEQEPRSGEVDRTSTGYLPHDQHEAQADRLFGAPDESAQGWERAVDAQARMVTIAKEILAEGRDTLLVGHGAVGTFLWCALAGRAIARVADQTSGGQLWAMHHSASGWQVDHAWQPIEELA